MGKRDLEMQIERDTIIIHDKDVKIAALKAEIVELKRMLNPNSADAANYDLGRADGLIAQNIATAALNTEIEKAKVRIKGYSARLIMNLICPDCFNEWVTHTAFEEHRQTCPALTPPEGE